MQNFDVKHGLVNYRAFQNQVIELLNQIEAIEAKEQKVGGSVIRMPEQNTGCNDQIKLDRIERKDKIRKKLERYMYYLNLADHFISSCPKKYQDMISEKYVYGDSQAVLSAKYNYSPRQILNIVDRIVDRYIEET